MNVHANGRDATNQLAREIAPARLRLVGQAQRDFGLLGELCPHDQERAFRARYVAPGVLEFEQVETATCGDAVEMPATYTVTDPFNPEKLAAAIAEEKKALATRSNEDLQEIAAQHGVAWNAKESKDTRLQKIALAVVAKANPPQAA